MLFQFPPGETGAFRQCRPGSTIGWLAEASSGNIYQKLLKLLKKKNFSNADDVCLLIWIIESIHWPKVLRADYSIDLPLPSVPAAPAHPPGHPLNGSLGQNQRNPGTSIQGTHDPKKTFLSLDNCQQQAPLLVVAPHTTIVDSIVIGAARATAVAKAELSKHPFIGPMGNLLQVQEHFNLVV